MARRPVATGAEAERARIRAAERDGVPWRRWAPILDDAGPTRLPGISGLVDQTSGLRLTVAMASPDWDPAAAVVRRLVATPTGSYLCSVVTTGSAESGHRNAHDEHCLELELRCAKRAPEDIVIRIRVANRGLGSTNAVVTVRLASIAAHRDVADPGRLTIRAPWEALDDGLPDDPLLLLAQHDELGTWWLAMDGLRDDPADVDGLAATEAVEDETGAAFRSRMIIQPGESTSLRLRLSRSPGPRPPVGLDAEATLGTRSREAAAFLADLAPEAGASLARLIWRPSPADSTDVVDQVFAALGLAVVDPVEAQRRLWSVIDQQVRGREASTDPPVAAWAALRIHELVESSTGSRDHGFLERVFHVLLEDYSGWVDRLDPSERNPLQGGLLDLDGTGSTAASTAWMACYSVWMLSLAVELARDDPTYQDVAVTFLDTTLAMVSALDDLGGSGIGMWDENDGWYHDVARGGDGEVARMSARSVIGLVPLLAVAVIPREALGRLPEVAVRLGWSLRHDVDLEGSVVRAPRDHAARGDMLVSLVPAYRRVRVLHRLDRGHPQIPVPMACLLLDVLDRLRAFGGWDPRDAPTLRSSLSRRLMHDAPVWAVLLAGAMRRAR